LVHIVIFADYLGVWLIFWAFSFVSCQYSVSVYSLTEQEKNYECGLGVFSLIPFFAFFVDFAFYPKIPNK